MASKNLGAVIQRAISDGAFRRQLQSDPAAALRGFNLSPDEIAAIRSGDSSKLMSLGVDQRMSKAFSVSGGLVGGTRSSVSDMGAAGTAGTIASDQTMGTREGIVGDPASSGRAGLADPTMSGTRAVHDSEPTDLRGMVSTGNVSGTRAVHDSEPTDLRGTVSSGD
ncbi:MAG TPA: Os1348 family NHLP clan protein, partial [Candidatus Limnocylindria bacterium]|nr:Os1348 family NHLP clan protein [Candidatus Limnocylindria bacterium]